MLTLVYGAGDTAAARYQFALELLVIHLSIGVIILFVGPKFTIFQTC